MSTRTYLSEISTLSTKFGTVETRLQERLRSQVLDHPGRQLVLKGLRLLTLRELALSDFLMNEVDLEFEGSPVTLPDSVRFEVKLTYEARVSHLDPRAQAQALDYRRELVLRMEHGDLSFFAGRGLQVLLKLMKQVRVYLVDPQRPRKTVRRRGYQDQGSMAPTDVKARRDANKQGAEEEKVGLERDATYLWASAILEAEKRGISLEELQAPMAGRDSAEEADWWGDDESNPIGPSPDEIFDDVERLRLLRGKIKKLSLENDHDH